MSGSFDINQFNLLVQQASDTLTCDSTCQENRQIEQLKKRNYNLKCLLLCRLPKYLSAVIDCL